MVDIEALSRDVEQALYDRRGGKKRGSEVAFRCPVHGDEHASAEYSPARGAWYCHGCGASGGLVAGEHPLAPLLGIGPTLEVDEAKRAEWAAERDAAEQSIAAEKAAKELALTAYWAAHERQTASEAHLTFLDELAAAGISSSAADFFGLEVGAHYGRRAHLIPWTVGGAIRALQYRLTGDVSGGRYRWHDGSRPTLYNADAVVTPDDDMILVVEGAKKAACLWSHGIPSVCAVVNKTGWRPEWAAQFAKFSRVLFALDPDALDQSRAAAATVPGARVVRWPMKPDDLLVATGGDVDLLMRYVSRAEVVR